MLCLNAAPARRVPSETLERADLVVANSFELETLDSRPLGGLFALTLGADGALLLEDGEEVARATPPSVEAVDGTAAGDAFWARLGVSLPERRPHPDPPQRPGARGPAAAARPRAQPSPPP